MNMSANPNLENIIRKVILPGLAGAAGGGALSGYAASRNNDPAESKGERRRRILRNAMYGSALGGVAGAAIPTGYSELMKPFFGSKSEGNMGYGARLGDAAFGGALHHALPLGAGVAGGIAAVSGNHANQEKALSRLSGGIGKGLPANMRPTNLQVKADITGDPANLPGVIGKYISPLNGGATPRNMFTANELMQEAGSPGLSLKDFAKHFPGTAGGPTPNYLNEYRQHLADQGPISKLVSNLATEQLPIFKNLRQNKLVEQLAARIPGVDRAAQGLEEFNPSGIAEAYGRYVRPSVGGPASRMAMLPKLGLLGAGMYGAGMLQDKLMGN